MKKLLFTPLILSMVFIFTGCSDDEDPVVKLPTQDIVEVAQANGFTSLAAALTKAGLVDDLQGDGPFTVFAPTNEAFASLLAAVGQTSVDDVPAGVLEQILLTHVITGKVLSTDIAAGNVTSLQGAELTLATNGGVSVNGSAVVTADVEASNGVIHIIESVLVPSDVAQFVDTVLEPAYFSESFTTLIEAAVKADVVGTLLDTPNLTIFAPTNDAFAASGIVPADVSKATLVEVLTYHVVDANVLSSGIPSSATTLNTEDIYFSLVSAGNFINGDTEITAVDIESGTGVVHVINQVLLPPSGNIVERAIELSEDGEFTSLIAALQRTEAEGTAAQDLIAVLSGDGPFTVFAPTNAAFQALLDSNSDWSTLADIPLATLVDVLTYHVVPARAYDKDLAGAVDSNDELPTAQGTNIAVDLTNLTLNTDSNIVGTNYNATNGVIHVIDKVILP